MAIPEESERLTVNVPTAGKLLGVSRVTAYALARQGIIPAIRLGYRLVVPKVALERMLAEAGIERDQS